jgi:hypothetical protein
LDSVGNQLRAVEARRTEVEKINERLEAADLITARALEEGFLVLGQGDAPRGVVRATRDL